MCASTPVPKGSPLEKAWTAYKASSSFENTNRWLAAGIIRGDQTLVLGQEWAIFLAGWEADKCDRHIHGGDDTLRTLKEYVEQNPGAELTLTTGSLLQIIRALEAVPADRDEWKGRANQLRDELETARSVHETQVWEFDRYVDGQLKAEGIRVSKATTQEQAFLKAVSMTSPGSVLVLRSTPETTADLNAVMWDEVRAAIVESPRFAEMYAAGGMLNDGVASTVAWLRESPAETTARPEEIPSRDEGETPDEYRRRLALFGVHVPVEKADCTCGELWRQTHKKAHLLGCPALKSAAAAPSSADHKNESNAAHDDILRSENNAAAPQLFPEYTGAIGEAGRKYLNELTRKVGNECRLPATFRWSDLWDVMVKAANIS
jgi:hypothetical protein